MTTPRASGSGRAWRRGGLLVVGLLGVATAAWWLLREHSPAPPPPPDSGGPVATPPATAATPPDSTSTPPTTGGATPPAAPDPLTTTLLDREWDALVRDAQSAASRGPEATRAFVLQLFAALDRLATDERVAVVYGFFESGRDARFGDAFAIGPGGFLREWPTLRVALFDYLAQRDGTAARVLAGTLLQSRPAEPGEWSLALRELVRGQSAEEWPEVVSTRLHEFLLDPGWNAEARRSWLEGFDVAVAGRSPAFLADLARIASQGSASARAAQFAAFLTADRIVLATPAAALATLNQDPALFATQPNVRAGLFARADVRQPAQMHELETYLARTDVTAEERRSFAGLFPLYDLAVSQNLLTPPAQRPLADMIAHDRATLAVLDRWLAQPQYAPWRGSLQEIRTRLGEQLAQVAPRTP
jgi:hypothetical protein